MQKKTRAWLTYALRLLASGGLILLVVQHVSWPDVKQVFSRADYSWLVWVLLALFVDRFLIACRWWLLLRANSVQISPINIVGINLIAMFWGYFLPSSFGVDVLNGYYVYRVTSKGSDTASSVVVDRLLGLLTLVLFGFIGLILWSSQSPAQAETDLQSVVWMLSAILAIVALGIIAVTNTTISTWVLGWLTRFENKKFVNFGIQTYQSLLRYKNKRGTLFVAFLISCLLQLTRIFLVYAIARMLNVELPLYYAFVVTSVMMIFVMLPISIGGVGVREATLGSMFKLAGLSVTGGVLVSLCITLADVLLVVLGGLLFLIYKPTPQISQKHNN